MDSDKGIEPVGGTEDKKDASPAGGAAAVSSATPPPQAAAAPVDPSQAANSTFGPKQVDAA